jgi:hypothetical protein
MTMTKSEIIKIQVGEEVIELTGQDKADFIADREATKAEAFNYLKRSTKPSKMHAHQL